MPQPFIILTLPRSRTYWASKFLSPQGKNCGHDLGIVCGSQTQFVDAFLKGLDGTIETGSVIGLEAIRKLMPGIKIFVIRRSVEQVLKSLAAFGLSGSELELDLRWKADLLDSASELPGVQTLHFDSLSGSASWAWLYEQTLGLPFDSLWYEKINQINLQVNMPERLKLLSERADAITQLKTELGVKPRYEPPIKRVVVAYEPFSSSWPEFGTLGKDHFQEVDEGVEHRRTYALLPAPLESASRSGLFRLITAREMTPSSNRLIGYLGWNVQIDVEAGGLLIALQGPWYLESGHPKVALQMWNRSLVELKLLGVKCLFPHHRLQGRGSQLDKFFQRQGAKPVKIEYSLWLDDAKSLKPRMKPIPNPLGAL